MRPTPVLARVLRGGRLESLHRGDVAVVDEDGRVLASSGDPSRRVFLRSAAKPFQAMPFLEAEGARAFRLGAEEIALMCASHSGEPRHVRVARRLLARGGFTEKDLACGPQLPSDARSVRALLSRGERPTRIHNNCSGKHAGLLLACRLFGFSPAGYERPNHPVQRKILACLSNFSGVSAARIPTGVDGCSLPAFFLPLSALARAYANLPASRRGAEGAGSRAARRLVLAAMTRHPGMVAGRAEFTTDFITAGKGRWIGKEGAEGVYAIALAPRRAGEKGIGIAFKIEDGSARARAAVALDILDRLGRLPASARRRIAPYIGPLIKNARGDEVGRVEAVVRLRRNAG